MITRWPTVASKGNKTFDAAFDQLFTLFDADKDNFKQTVVYFLSDSAEQISLDDTRISKFTNLPDIENRLRFFGVAFGNEASLPSFEKICFNMPNGDFTFATSNVDLKKSVLRLIQ
uniref:Uncharacterized protein n=1 Tax=Strombidium inclinatum TaxID=197538 RepID=A0A7S3IER3_9SPIT|mmetsp:Transcript_14698/g.22779  ORF Transcript_14698/g.22779 Transcript_14698/m.22779 type:complete len:116 (+) Transcript_14698:190-537(+)